LIEDHLDQLNPEGRRVLGVVCAEAARMGQLIDDLLTFFRMSRRAMSRDDIDMETLARRVFGDLDRLENNRDIRCDVRTLPPARGDAGMIRQVLTNLLSNAIKYTRPRPVAQIEVGTRAMDGETAYYVQDNGVGFDMQYADKLFGVYADKLFGVFQRLHSDQEFEGTGVGLALVQRILRRHGGRIWAQSQTDQGATFWFTVPPPPEAS
jgi:light-regulated signal transduction histidine kinase (bacteriophytochrome)